MIAALDSSALILLAKVDGLKLLQRLFQAVVLAPAVRDEAITLAPTPGEQNALSIEVERRRFATTSPSTDVAKRFAHDYPALGTGELETLALVASKKAHVAVIDDRIARQIARLEGIAAVGTLGVLARAYRKNLVSKSDLVRLLERLTGAGLWLSPDVLEAFWAGVGGR